MLENPPLGAVRLEEDHQSGSPTENRRVAPMSAARTPRIPAYRLHKAYSQAVVTLNGRDHYLGKHGTSVRPIQVRVPDRSMLASPLF